jgi:hypothetical protein
MSNPSVSTPPNVSVLVECGGRRYRVIDNLRALVGRESERTVSESIIGRQVLDLARKMEAGNDSATSSE